MPRAPAPPISDPAETAFRAFIRASGLFRNCMEPYFARHGVSAAQWGVLRSLHRAEAEGFAGLQLNVLGQRLLVRPPSVTTILDRLERAGLVLRRPDPQDQRAKQVALTQAGRELVARVLVRHPAHVRGVMGCFTRPEQRNLLRLMEKLAGHLAALNEASAPLPNPGERNPPPPAARAPAARAPRRGRPKAAHGSGGSKSGRGPSGAARKSNAGERRHEQD